MLTRTEPPRASHVDCNAERITREDLNVGLGTSITDVSRNEANKTVEALERPKGNDAVHHVLLRHTLEMDPHTSDCSGCC